MFKTISAALLAVSVLAAPAFAATGKTAQAPVVKTSQTKATPTPTKSGALNANATLGKHHAKHARHHSQHKKMAVHRSHAKVSYKHTSHAVTKRG